MAERSLRADEADKPEGSQGALDLLAQFVPGSRLLVQALFEPVGHEPVGLGPIQARAALAARKFLARLSIPFWRAAP
jgi:hypothetical protein